MRRPACLLYSRESRGIRRIGRHHSGGQVNHRVLYTVTIIIIASAQRRTKYFQRYIYDSDNGSFENLQPFPSAGGPDITCHRCLLTSHLDARESMSPSLPSVNQDRGALSVGGMPIHVLDFVYVSPAEVDKKAPSPFRVAQVIKIITPTRSTTSSALSGSLSGLDPSQFKVTVCWYWRNSDLATSRQRSLRPSIVTSDVVCQHFLLTRFDNKLMYIYLSCRHSCTHPTSPKQSQSQISLVNVTFGAGTRFPTSARIRLSHIDFMFMPR